jgi:hypothetical protein
MKASGTLAHYAAWIIGWGLAIFAGPHASVADELEWIQVASEKRSFVQQPSGRPFVPWGVNYDHDETEAGRLIEDYWETEWDKVEADFREIKQLGANVVRVHLQFGKFMDSADRPNAKQLAQLRKLLKLAESTGLYLDLTGLGCYHKKDVPPWYDELDEAARWSAQARFWEAVAEHCRDSSAVFCYDLMNEPIVPGGAGKQEHWLAGDLGGKFFVQFITRERKDRPRAEVAQQWIERLVEAVRKQDSRHLITVGLIPDPPSRPGQLAGFLPEQIAKSLDFFSIHIYPRQGKLEEALQTVKGFAIGKPVVIEELFPLHCSADELGQFIDQSKGTAAGWIGFYWGKTPDEYRGSDKFSDVLTLNWLELFRAKTKGVRGE